MARYELWIADDNGDKLEPIGDITALTYIKNPGAVGWFTLTAAYDKSSLLSDFDRQDRQIHIWRAPAGGSLGLNAVYFVEDWNVYDDGSGMMIELSGSGLNRILESRIVAKYAESSGAQMLNVAADDMMKQIVTNEIGASAVAGRDLSAAGFSVQPKSTSGIVIDKAFSWRNVLQTLQDIQSQTRNKGSEVLFSVVATGTNPLTCEFRTYIELFGQDRTMATNNPLVFSIERGNLSNPRFQSLTSNSINHVYVGGAGENADRLIEEVSNPNESQTSKWGRREGFLSNPSVKTPSVLAANGNTRLAERGMKTKFSADIKDTVETPYGGSGWHVGDKVVIYFAGREFVAIIRRVKVAIDSVNGEVITGSVSI